jgi:hypothetical protein
MGSRIVASSLVELGRNAVEVPALHHVVFAAADIPTSGCPDLWTGMQKLSKVDYSFYDSNHDLALRLSKIENSGQRVGDTTGGILIPEGAATIDASQIDIAWQAFGHSYITKSLKVGSDIAVWVDTNDFPDSPVRGLHKHLALVRRWWNLDPLPPHRARLRSRRAQGRDEQRLGLNARPRRRQAEAGLPALRSTSRK